MRQRLGQHFLRSQSILSRIAEVAAPSPDATVIEIGPGKGALTGRLLPRCARLVAVEVDSVLVHYLRQKFRDEPKLTIVHDDILKTDLAQYGPIFIAGNLPYYITSPIVERVLMLGPQLQRAIFLVQREVADRMAAQPGSRDYGFLSVQVQLLSEARVLFTVAPGAFSPPPKVESAVIELRPRAEPLVPDTAAFLRFASTVFRHKRKTLRNNLLGAYDKNIIESFPEASKRAEQLSLQQLLDLHSRILKV